MRTGAYLLLATVLVSSMPALGTAASVAEGKKLFASPELGTNGKSCATCHQEGKGLGDLSGLDRDELASAVNACLTRALEGKALAEDSEALNSLVLYLQSLNAK
jgi:cytochrome c